MRVAAAEHILEVTLTRSDLLRWLVIGTAITGRALATPLLRQVHPAQECLVARVALKIFQERRALYCIETVTHVIGIDIYFCRRRLSVRRLVIRSFDVQKPAFASAGCIRRPRQ